MRASSFSNPQVITLLSQYFVPVWFSVNDYTITNSQADWDEWRRIQKGNVMVYLVAPGGAVLATMNVTESLDAEKNLLPLLNKVIKDSRLQPRKAAAIRASAAPARPLVPQPQTKGGLVLQVWISAGTVGDNTVEEWVELAPNEWATLVPSTNVRAHFPWQVPPKVADKLYQYFYPPVCNYKSSDGKVLSSSLTASVATFSEKEVQLVLRGTLKLKHDLTDNGSVGGEVNADIVGVATYDRKRRVITSLQMVAEKVSYVSSWQGKETIYSFDVVVELVHREPRTAS